MRAIGDESRMPEFRAHTHKCPMCKVEWRDWNPQCSRLTSAYCDECEDKEEYYEEG